MKNTGLISSLLVVVTGLVRPERMGVRLILRLLVVEILSLLIVMLILCLRIVLMLGLRSRGLPRLVVSSLLTPVSVVSVVPGWVMRVVLGVRGILLIRGLSLSNSVNIMLWDKSLILACKID